MTLKLRTDEFDTLAVCSVRYALGRKTYMPDLVREIITPWLEVMSSNALLAIANTLTQPWNPKDLDPEWAEFERDVRAELKSRGEYW